MRRDGKFKGVCLLCSNSPLGTTKCDWFAHGIPHRSLRVDERNRSSGHVFIKYGPQNPRNQHRRHKRIIQRVNDNEKEERLVMAEHNAFLCPVCQNRCVICNKYGLVPPFWDRCAKCTEKSVLERKAVHNIEITIDPSIVDRELLLEAKMLETADEEVEEVS